MERGSSRRASTTNVIKTDDTRNVGDQNGSGENMRVAAMCWAVRTLARKTDARSTS
jgi:hypothetical protein